MIKPLVVEELTEENAEVRDDIHEIAFKLEEALFATFSAADAHGRPNRHELRRASKTAWRELSDMLISFALDSDR